jgi:hypothetical protein
VKFLTGGPEDTGKIFFVDERNDQPVYARPEAPAAWRTGGHDTQVFVDDSGRRALGVRMAGFALAALCAFWLAGLAVGMAGFSGFPAPSLHALARTGLARPLFARGDAVVDRVESARRVTAAAYRAARLDALDTRLADSSRVSTPCSAAGPASRSPLAVDRPAMPQRSRREKTAQASAAGGALRSACRPQPAAARRARASSRLT